MTATAYDPTEHTASTLSIVAGWSVIGTIFLALVAV